MFIERDTSRHSADAIDVQSLLSQRTCGSRYLLGCKFTSQKSKYISVFALHPNPCVVFFARNGVEAQINVKLRSLEEQLLHHVSGVFFFRFKEDAQRKCIMNVGLTDVHYVYIVF